MDFAADTSIFDSPALSIQAWWKSFFASLSQVLLQDKDNNETKIKKLNLFMVCVVSINIATRIMLRKPAGKIFE